MEKTKPYDIVVVSGGFDPLHKGHVRLFNEAKKLGHKVICGLNSDKWLVKKNGQVHMNFGERTEIISSFRSVDEVISFNDDDDSAISLLVRVQSLYPECSICFVNGGQMEEKNTPESGFCRAYGIDMLWDVGGGPTPKSNRKAKS
jgi:D-beta-D-heptose 7-phosphate kinase/D-beta-D-heptose 1-phosphate adenosyltransferase